MFAQGIRKHSIIYLITFFLSELISLRFEAAELAGMRCTREHKLQLVCERSVGPFIAPSFSAAHT